MACIKYGRKLTLNMENHSVQAYLTGISFSILFVFD